MGKAAYITCIFLLTEGIKGIKGAHVITSHENITVTPLTFHHPLYTQTETEIKTRTESTLPEVAQLLWPELGFQPK